MSAAEPGLVLVVDDDPEVRSLVKKLLDRAGLASLHAGTGLEALALATAHVDCLDAVLLDVRMPGLDGYCVLERLKRDPRTAAIPVVLLSAHATSDPEIVRGMETGAADHLVKPFSASVLVSKVRAACRGAQQGRHLRALLGAAESDATIDALTQLHNRRHFDARLVNERATARRYALLCFDIDHFKSVNDAFGHPEGDRVLAHVARVIRQARADDSAFRCGGDEFAIVFSGCDERGAIAAGDRLAATLRDEPIIVGDGPRVITFSGGVAAADEHNGFDGARVVARADAALYRAKKLGRDRVIGESTR